MLVWLAEHLVKYYSGFNVFFLSDVSRHRQPADCAVHLVVDGPAHDCPSAKTLFRPFVRNDGPESHFSKRGTPTMGGIMILTAIVVSVLLWAYPSNPVRLVCPDCAGGLRNHWIC